MSLAWGGYGNGSPQIQAVLVQAEGGVAGDLLELNTARAWSGWRNEIHAQTGVWLELDHSDSIPPAFRNVAFQQKAWDNYQRYGKPIAAVVRTSNHGWGRAFDCTGFENRADVWAAMNALAPKYGLSWATGDASGERWHWESLNAPVIATASVGDVTVIPTGDEVDMASIAEINQGTTTIVNTAVQNILSGIRRESRGRLYYCATPPAGLPNFVCIFWDRAENNILYANDGETQASNWNTVYYQTADTVAQAKAAAVSPDQFQKLIAFAQGKDTAFTNNRAK